MLTNLLSFAARLREKDHRNVGPEWLRRQNTAKRIWSGQDLFGENDGVGGIIEAFAYFGDVFAREGVNAVLL